MIGVDKRFQGKGYGGDLLVDCLRRLARASETLGVVVVMLDVLDCGGAAQVERRLALYRGYGFEPLATHPKVEAVLTAGGLGASEAQQALAARQCLGQGSTFSIRIRGGEAEAFALLNALRVFKLAVSLGGTESLASHPSSTTHSDYSPEAKRRSGITDNLVRLSVGIDDPDDLWADLEAALNQG